MMNYKIYISAIFIVLVCSISCKRNIEVIPEQQFSREVKYNDNGNIISHETYDDYMWEESNITTISAQNSRFVISGSGVSTTENTATITSSGAYRVKGNISDGQLIVNTADNGIVQLLFDGLSAHSSTSAPIYIANAQKTILILEEGSQNTITDKAEYSSFDLSINSAIFSRCPLTITGTGQLNVQANNYRAITSTKGLLIKGGNISVSSKEDGIYGKDYIIVDGGNTTIQSKNNALLSDNYKSQGCGYIEFIDGQCVITSSENAVFAETGFIMSGGNLSITSGGGYTESNEENGKAIKSGIECIITGGTLNIDASDDAIHSNGDVKIAGCTLHIATANDGIHADGNVVIEKGSNINITHSYEGIESSKGNITINGGQIRIKSIDDGINLTAGFKSPERMFAGFENPNSGTYSLIINNGFIVVDSKGDGLDSNDGMTINGGTIVVSGTSAEDNQAIDWDSNCSFNGGTVVATSSKQMAGAPDETSTQNSAIAHFDQKIPAETLLHIADEKGRYIFSIIAPKEYDAILFTSPKLKRGTSYSIYQGGSTTGVFKDGLSLQGEYTSGVKVANFTISNTITTINYSHNN